MQYWSKSPNGNERYVNGKDHFIAFSAPVKGTSEQDQRLYIYGADDTDLKGSADEYLYFHNKDQNFTRADGKLSWYWNHGL